MNFPEALQFLYRTRNRGYLILHIQLNYFLSCTLTGISHFYRHLRMDACSLARQQFQIRISKIRVRKPISERIGRLSGSIDIRCLIGLFQCGRAAGALILIINGNLSYVCRKCHGQFSRRIILSPQHIAYGIAGLTSQPPSTQYRISMFPYLIEDYRTPTHDKSNDRFSSLCQFRHQLLLPLGYGYIHFGSLLATLTESLAYRHNNDIRSLSSL